MSSITLWLWKDSRRWSQLIRIQGLVLYIIQHQVISIRLCPFPLFCFGTNEVRYHLPLTPDNFRLDWENTKENIHLRSLSNQTRWLSLTITNDKICDKMTRNYIVSNTSRFTETHFLVFDEFIFWIQSFSFNSETPEETKHLLKTKPVVIPSSHFLENTTEESSN